MNTRNGNGNGNGGTTTAAFDDIKDSVKNLVDQGQERATAIKERVIDVKDQAMTRGSDLLEQATDTIKAHPLKSVAIAFGIGYVGMRLFR